MEKENNASNRHPSPEKSLQYAQTKSKKDKERRQQRRQEKISGKIHGHRLSFMTEILKAYRITRTELARRLHCTTPNLYWIFTDRDDCSLLKAKEILAAVGLKLDVEIVPSTSQKTSSMKTIEETEYLTDDNVPNKIVTRLPELSVPPTHAEMPKYITDYPDGKNLSFLARYIEKAGYPVPVIENLIGASRSSIRQFFIRESGDINISKIYDIARETNGQINWLVDKL